MYFISTQIACMKATSLHSHKNTLAVIAIRFKKSELIPFLPVINELANEQGKKISSIPFMAREWHLKNTSKSMYHFSRCISHSFLPKFLSAHLIQWWNSCAFCFIITGRAVTWGNCRGYVRHSVYWWEYVKWLLSPVHILPSEYISRLINAVSQRQLYIEIRLIQRCT